MRTRYLSGIVEALDETELAFLCTFDWSTDESGYVGHRLWIPKSVIHDDSLDDIDFASDGDLIDIAIAEWWLKQLG